MDFNIVSFQILRRNIMSKRKSIISVAVGSAFAVTLGVAPIASAAENPFSMQPMEKGYMVAEAGKYDDKKAGEGKCGESRCGAAMADTDKDGKITKEEWDKHHDAMFEKMDANKDGTVDKDEIDKMKAEKRKMHGDKQSY
jgi:uncharacterized low-complexity protein